jgi:hypothetical protein
MYVDYCRQLRKKKKEQSQYTKQVKKALYASKNAPMRHY